MHWKDTKSVSSNVLVKLEKPHTCEEGGAHLRISFWHLLMNIEKPEIPEFWKNEKNC